MKVNQLSATFLAFISYNALHTEGFAPIKTAPTAYFRQSSFQHSRDGKNYNVNSVFEAKKETQNDDEPAELVTKEMFLRDMLEEAKDDNYGYDENEDELSSEPKKGKVKRKKRNGSHYRVLDNRDNLPFLVKVTTPDPYTNNDVMAKRAKKNTEELAKGSKAKKNKKNLSNKRHNLIGMDGVDSIKSSIFKRKKDGSLETIIGEFALDKATNCGDIIDVGDGREYQVQKARCQYKYVGGKKFVMTRKILEVKEMKRILVEKEVKQLFENNGESNDDDILQLE